VKRDACAGRPALLRGVGVWCVCVCVCDRGTGQARFYHLVWDRELLLVALYHFGEDTDGHWARCDPRPGLVFRKPQGQGQGRLASDGSETRSGVAGRLVPSRMALEVHEDAKPTADCALGVRRNTRADPL
jgi:hypothetical protein